MDSLVVLLVIAGISLILARVIVTRNVKLDKKRDVLQHPETGETRVTYKGFSWPAFFFTPIWCLIKDLYMQVLLSLFFPFLVWIIAGFKGNQWHYDSLIEKRFVPKEQVEEEEIDTKEEIDSLDKLEKLQELRERGAISER